jgi:hypothetical protein
LRATAAYSIIIALGWAADAAQVSAQGQQGSGSPYSAFGFGDLWGATQVVQASAGGIGLAVADPFSLAPANPASYTSLQHAVFEAGLAVRGSRYESTDMASTGRSSKLMGITIGVPFGRGRWGMGMGLTPASSVSYRLTERMAVEGGEAEFVYAGSGGLNKAFFGLGRVLWQRRDSTASVGRLTLGANLEYLFGNVETSRKAYYPATSGYYNSSATSALVIRSPSATAGLQYTDDLLSLKRAQARMRARKERLQAKDRSAEQQWLNRGLDPKDRRPIRIPKGTGEALRFRVGLAAELPAALGAKHTVLVNSFRLGSNGVEFPLDTVQSIDGAQGSVRLPVGIGVGLTVHNDHWSVTAEHRTRDWSRTEFDVEGFTTRSQLVRGSVYALGASYRPAGMEAGNLLTGSIYRMGLRYADDYVTVKGTAIQQIGMSFGISLPVAFRSRINLGTELGQRGTTENGLLRERYANLFIGVSITPERNEPWFRKRRIE